MEADRVALGEGAHERPHPVGVAQVEGRVPEQALHLGERSGQARRGLQGEPLVDHQRVRVPAPVESVEGLGPLGDVEVREHPEGAHGVGHVVGLPQLRDGERRAGRSRDLRQIGEAEIPERPLPHLPGLDPVGAAASVGVVGQRERFRELRGQRAPQELPRGVGGLGVGHRHLVHQIGLAGQRQGLGGEGRVGGAFLEHPAKGVHQVVGAVERAPGPGVLAEREKHARGEPLACVPATEGVRVVRHQEGELPVALLGAQAHGGREAPEQGGHRTLGDVDEAEGLLGVPQGEDPGGPARGRLAREPQGEVLAARVQEPERDRDVHGPFPGLPRRGRAALGEGQLEGVRRRVVGLAHAHLRCAGLAVPEPELAEVRAVGVLHGAEEVLDGHRLAVVAREVQVHAPAEALLPEQGVGHADHLGPLLVDRGGVEVVDLDVGLRAHRVGHGARVLGELVRA